MLIDAFLPVSPNSIPVTEDDIVNPQSEVIKGILSTYVDLFLNLSPEDIKQVKSHGTFRVFFFPLVRFSCCSSETMACPLQNVCSFMALIFYAERMPCCISMGHVNIISANDSLVAFVVECRRARTP